MFRSITKFKKFDKITNFRLKNSLMNAFGMSLIAPVLVILKGTLMVAWVVSLFSVGNMLAVKTNNYMVEKFSVSTLYKMGALIHVFILISSLVYFLNPVIMVWVDSILVIMSTSIFSAYSIVLNNYIADSYPKDMKEFQIVRNSSWADGALLGLGVTATITFFLPLSYAIGFFILFNIIFLIWMLYNWKFYDNLEIK